jgi:sugar-specific transcriptional regulator TrmB
MGNKDLLEKIKQERDNKAKIYTKTYPEMVAEYQRELETIKGYNGRQILELLQNCDDQSAKNVKIVVNTENGIFSIENDGESFSLEGYRSLFIANLSSKVNKQKYIGNKGLGFRSIINWQ